MNVAVSVPSPPSPPPEGEGSVMSRLRDFHDNGLCCCTSCLIPNAAKPFLDFTTTVDRSYTMMLAGLDMLAQTGRRRQVD